MAAPVKFTFETVFDEDDDEFGPAAPVDTANAPRSADGLPKFMFQESYDRPEEVAASRAREEQLIAEGTKGRKLKFGFDVSFDDPTDDEMAAQALADLEEVAADTEAEVDAEDAESADEAVEPEPEPEPEPEVTFTEDDLVNERTRAYKEGKQAGNEEAWSQFRQQTDQMAVKALKVIGDHMKDLFTTQDEHNDRTYRDATAISVVMARKILPDMCERNALREVERVLRECLTMAIEEPKLIIRVNEKLVDDLERRLGALIEELGYGGRILIEVDDRMGLSDVKVEWSTGGAERDTARLWEQIEGAIARSMDLSHVPSSAGRDSFEGAGALAQDVGYSSELFSRGPSVPATAPEEDPLAPLPASSGLEDTPAASEPEAAPLPPEDAAAREAEAALDLASEIPDLPPMPEEAPASNPDPSPA